MEKNITKIDNTGISGSNDLSDTTSGDLMDTPSRYNFTKNVGFSHLPKEEPKEDIITKEEKARIYKKTMRSNIN